MGTDSARIGQTRPAKQLDMHGPLIELASHLAFSHFRHNTLHSNNALLNQTPDYTLKTQAI